MSRVDNVIYVVTSTMCKTRSLNPRTPMFRSSYDVCRGEHRLTQRSNYVSFQSLMTKLGVDIELFIDLVVTSREGGILNPFTYTKHNEVPPSDSVPFSRPTKAPRRRRRYTRDSLALGLRASCPP